jgi:hypothetical protein
MNNFLSRHNVVLTDLKQVYPFFTFQHGGFMGLKSFAVVSGITLVIQCLLSCNSPTSHLPTLGNNNENIQYATSHMYPSPLRVGQKGIGKFALGYDLIVTMTDMDGKSPVCRVGRRNADGSVTNLITSTIPTGTTGKVNTSICFNNQGDIIAALLYNNYVYYIPGVINLNSNSIYWKPVRLLSGIRANYSDVGRTVGVAINQFREVVFVWANENVTQLYYSTAAYDEPSGTMNFYKYDNIVPIPVVRQHIDLSIGGSWHDLLLLLNSFNYLGSGKLNWESDYSITWNLNNMIYDNRMRDVDIDANNNISIIYSWNFANGPCDGFQIDHQTGYYNNGNINLRNDRRRAVYIQGCSPNGNELWWILANVAREDNNVMIFYPLERHNRFTFKTLYSGAQLLSVENDPNTNTFISKGTYTLVKYENQSSMDVDLDY